MVGVRDAYELIHSGWPPFKEWRLYAVGLDGGPSRLLLPPDFLPDFGFIQATVSPDGQHVAFTGFQLAWDVNYIFVANADGSDPRQITAGGVEGQPSWSPDGTRIAYVSWPRGRHADIWVMNADGSDPVNLTGAMNDGHQYTPAWSRALPGGDRIAFGERTGNDSHIWTMRPDGTDRRRVTAGAGWWDSDPSWSPDGSRIVFQRDGPGTEAFDIWVVDATGDNARSLVKLPDGQSVPEWSPDGRLIAFNSAHADDVVDKWVVYTVGSDGTNLVRRSFDPLMSAWATWRVAP